MVERIEYKAPIGKSHHCIIQCSLRCYNITEGAIKQAYKYNSGDYLNINKTLMEIDWECSLANKTIDESWDFFEEKMKTAIDSNIPKVRLNKSSGNKMPLWMNKETIAKIKKKNQYFREYKKDKSNDSYRKYCKSRNQAKKACKRSMKNFETQIAKESKNNPKAFHKYVKSKINIKSGVTELEEKGLNYSKDQDKANVLNRFFSSVFVKENVDTIPSSNTPEKCHQGQGQTENELCSIDFTSKDIEKIISKLNVNKSAGPDGLHPRVLRETAGSIAIPLQIIFKKSLQQEQLPTAWKRATITPIFKKGNRKDPSNYRPVSLTSICCKVMETLVREAMMDYLEGNDIITPHNMDSQKENPAPHNCYGL